MLKIMDQESDAVLAAEVIARGYLVSEIEALALRRRLAHFDLKQPPDDTFIQRQINLYERLLTSWYGSPAKQRKPV